VLAQSPRASTPQSGATPAEPAALEQARQGRRQLGPGHGEVPRLAGAGAGHVRAELARQTELAEIRQELYESGTLSASDVQQGRPPPPPPPPPPPRALVKAQKDVDDIRRQRLEVDRMMVEMRMIEVGKQRPLGRGGYEEMQGLVRFNGTARGP